MNKLHSSVRSKADAEASTSRQITADYFGQQLGLTNDTKKQPRSSVRSNADAEASTSRQITVDYFGQQLGLTN